MMPMINRREGINRAQFELSFSKGESESGQSQQPGNVSNRRITLPGDRRQGGHFKPEVSPETPKRIELPVKFSPGRITEFYKPFPKILGEEMLKEIKKTETLRDVIWGYFEGRDWIMKHFGWSGEMPPLEIVDFGDTNPNKVIFMFKYHAPSGHVRVNVRFLRVLQNYSSHNHIQIPSQGTIPADELPSEIRPYLTLRQISNSGGIEENTHFLAYQGVPGLTRLEDDKPVLPTTAPYIPYMRQQHELEGALVYPGMFFKEKYGMNPYTDLEQYIRSAEI